MAKDPVLICDANDVTFAQMELRYLRDINYNGLSLSELYNCSIEKPPIKDINREFLINHLIPIIQKRIKYYESFIIQKR